MVGHPADAGDHRDERPHDLDACPQDHGERAVPREERLGAQRVLLPEEAGAQVGEDPRAEAAPTREPTWLTRDGGDEHSSGQIQNGSPMMCEATRPARAKQRVTGQEEPRERPVSANTTAITSNTANGPRV